MTCERRAHPYLDATGHRKYFGDAQTGAESCPVVRVDSNVLDVAVEVSTLDDFGRPVGGSGTTPFCLEYSLVCDTGPVIFTAPSTGGTGNWDFRRWVVDGINQPGGQLAITLDPCDGACHTLFARYGDVIIIEGVPCAEGLELPEVAIVRATSHWNLDLCVGTPFPGCPSGPQGQGAQCVNQVWNSEPSNLEVVLSSVGIPPGGGVWQAVYSLLDCFYPHPNDPEICTCGIGPHCSFPALACVVDKPCLFGCNPGEDWALWIRRLAAFFAFTCECLPNSSRVTWDAGVSKAACQVNMPLSRCGCPSGAPIPGAHCQCVPITENRSLAVNMPAQTVNASSEEHGDCAGATRHILQNELTWSFGGPVGNVWGCSGTVQRSLTVNII
ncbi:MAG: hypothetical protein IID41_03050 [Planctomycetes bacterium]|nr:hypothetical protein [Planctomycetota bacterium]